MRIKDNAIRTAFPISMTKVKLNDVYAVLSPRACRLRNNGRKSVIRLRENRGNGRAHDVSIVIIF